MTARPFALTIAGSDPTGGAGIQRDLRTFGAHGVYGLSAVTAITVQGSRGVVSVTPLPARLVREQIEAVLEGIDIRAVKTGMLVGADTIREIAAALRDRAGVPLVIDPVVASTSGAELLDRDGVRALMDDLLPGAAVVTPNLAELRILLGEPREARDVDELAEAAGRLRMRGAAAVVAKGGHLAGSPVDVLVDADGVRTFGGERIAGAYTHGTGCTFASAIAARLAHGASMAQAVAEAKAFVGAELRGGVGFGA